MNERITVGVPSKERYDFLLLLLNSLLLQTYKNFDVIVVDDSAPDKRVDLRQVPIYKHIFNMFDRFKIGWEIIFGSQEGQVKNHLKVLEKSKNQWVLRCDDDHVLEPTCIQQLVRHIGDDKLCAVASRVVHSDQIFPPEVTSSKIEDVLSKYALQFTEFNDVREVDHFYSTFLASKDLIKSCYPTNLSKIGHREESTTSIALKKKGYKLLVDGSSIIYHFRAPTGGIRAYQNPLYWDLDDKIFKDLLRKERIKLNEYYPIVINSGIGDNYCLRNILPDIQKKQKDKKIFLATVYPWIYWDVEGIEVASIHGAKILFGEDAVNKLDPYKLGFELGGNISLLNAFKKIYGV